MIPRVIIEKQANRIIRVLSNEEIEYILVDYDVYEGGCPLVSKILVQDNKDIHFPLHLNYNSPGENNIKRALKKLNF